MSQVTLSIDGRTVSVRSSATILDAASALNIRIPTLCHHPTLKPEGSCRLCVVEVEKAPRLVPACARTVEEGMKVTTSSERILRARRLIVELLLAEHSTPCSSEGVDGCELEALAAIMGISTPRFPRAEATAPVDRSSRGIVFNLNYCILCGRCVRACGDVQVNEVIAVSGRGSDAKVSFDFDDPMGSSRCTECGECIAYCPTGALFENLQPSLGQPARSVETVCPYCGVGCMVRYDVAGDTILRARGVRGSPVNKGMLCVKGKFGFDFTMDPARLTKPLIRLPGIPKEPLGERKPSEVFREASWDEALDLVSKRLLHVKKQSGGDAIYGFSSAKCTNEENYAFQKFMRAVLGTNNVDTCTRLCHSSSVYALDQALGSGAATNSLGDISASDVIVVVGSNTTETHPVVASFIKQAVKKGSTLIVIDPRRINLAKNAHMHLQPRPGTDVALFNGLAWIITREQLHNREFITNRTQGFDEFLQSIQAYTPDVVERITGVPKKLMQTAGRTYARAANAAVYWGMGVSQHTAGTAQSFALINLALLTGHIGRWGAGLNPLRGQNNVQGASDVGALPYTYPGYQPFDSEVLERFEAAWGIPLNKRLGITGTEMITAALNGQLKAVFVMGENPLLSHPNVSNVEKAFNRLDFLVVQDIFLTETAELADVILPGASPLEKDGTYVNTERRVQLGRKVVNPPGDAREDLAILSELATRMGYNLHCKSWIEAWNEIRTLTPMFSGITIERLQGDGVQWPCPSMDHPGTPTMHENTFPRGVGRFNAVEFLPPKELPDEQYPFILITGRVLEHWHTGTMTRRSRVLEERSPHPHVEISQSDADDLQLHDGETVRVHSRRGAVCLRVRTSRNIKAGCLFIPFHFKEAVANLLTVDYLDPYGKAPEYKFCAVSVEKLESTQTHE